MKFRSEWRFSIEDLSAAEVAQIEMAVRRTLENPHNSVDKPFLERLQVECQGAMNKR